MLYGTGLPGWIKNNEKISLFQVLYRRIAEHVTSRVGAPTLENGPCAYGRVEVSNQKERKGDGKVSV